MDRNSLDGVDSASLEVVDRATINYIYDNILPHMLGFNYAC